MCMQACMLEWDFNESHWVIQSFQINVAEKIFMSSFVCNGGHSKCRIWKFNGSHTYPYHYTTSLSLCNPLFPLFPGGDSSCCWPTSLFLFPSSEHSDGKERAAAILLILGTGWNHERAPGGREHWGEVFEVSKGNRPRLDTCWNAISMIWILNTFNHENTIQIIARMGSIYHTCTK